MAADNINGRKIVVPLVASKAKMTMVFTREADGRYAISQTNSESNVAKIVHKPKGEAQDLFRYFSSWDGAQVDSDNNVDTVSSGPEPSLASLAK